jgi:hypothetical protein
MRLTSKVFDGHNKEVCNNVFGTWFPLLKPARRVEVHYVGDEGLWKVGSIFECNPCLDILDTPAICPIFVKSVEDELGFFLIS